MASDSPKFDPKRVWRTENREKVAENRVKAATAPSCYDDDSGAVDEEAKSDWERLRLTAKVIFPDELAAKFNLHAKQRLAAIAHVLGWTPSKISKASKIPRGTLYLWAKREEFKEFIKAFEYHRGNKDSKELVEVEQYSAIQVLRELMHDTSVSASTRKDIAVWFFEQKHGKPKETRENVGADVRKLTEELMTARGAAKPKDLLDFESFIADEEPEHDKAN